MKGRIDYFLIAGGMGEIFRCPDVAATPLPDMPCILATDSESETNA